MVATLKLYIWGKYKKSLTEARLVVGLQDSRFNGSKIVGFYSNIWNWKKFVLIEIVYR